ncbi:MAG: C-terminal binding protein [Terriglobia bacterium]
MTRLKVVITDHRFADVEQERRAVEAAGGQLVVGQATEEQQLIELCRDADGILNGRSKVTAPVIAAMGRCRIIVRYGIGVDTIDIGAATAHGIMVANVPDYCIDEVSDHALTLLLMLSRQIVPSMALATEDRWILSKMPPLHRLRGQVCGLCGAGQIGSLLSGKVRKLGMHVMVYDPYLNESRAQEIGAEKVSIDALLARADFISIHAPLNDETNHLFDEPAFKKMKNTAFIINTARGGLIDEGALLAAVNAGDIGGAALDVLESETEVTPVRRALLANPKVILTAHTAWLSDEARVTLQARAVAQVISCLKGGRPYGIINGSLERVRVTPTG